MEVVRNTFNRFLPWMFQDIINSRFCPSVFLYLASVCPSIWLIELEKLDTRRAKKLMSTGEGAMLEEITTEVAMSTTTELMTSPILSAIANETFSLDDGNGTGGLVNGSGVDLGGLKDMGVNNSFCAKLNDKQ